MERFYNPNERVGMMRLQIAHDAERIAALEARLLERQLAASAVIGVQQRAICALELELAELRAEQELAVTPIDIWRLDHAE